LLRLSYTVLVFALITALAVVTLFPMTDLQVWWVRAMDFPRLQILAAGVLIAFLSFFLANRMRVPALLVTLAFSGFQAWTIFPYTPLAPTEIELASPNDSQLQFLAANVLMENRDHEAIADIILREDPDVVFLMETDQTWVDALAPVLSNYKNVLMHPQDNHYGLIFATKLAGEGARLLDIGDADKPTLFAELQDRQGKVFRFVGLHPPPPVPGQDTDIRDAKIAYAARFARKSGVPVVIMGDFNQAAWSHLALQFKRFGGYLDPRIGRGPLPSFDATHPLLRYPIDQLYVTPDVAVVDFSRGENIGSDHFPMLATIRIDPEIAAELNAEPEVLEQEELADIKRMVDDHAATLEIDIRDR
jgi:endonuclease/exonuclease/phosphatase (EEP) superfamily protein YafD